MATLRTSIQVTDGMSPAFRAMNNAMNIVINSFEAIQSASHNAVDTSSIQAARQELARAEVSLNQVEREITEANNRQQQFNNSLRNGKVEANGLAQKINGFIGAYVGLQSIEKGIEVTDTYTNQSARLALINDGLQTQEQLQQKIYQAAQRSRGEYNDTVNVVAKLGLLAKDAFKGNDETIKFAELMTKSFKISGASIQESTAGMYQLTQALAAGKLQGDEFRSVMENAPMLAQAIAKYTGKSMGELKEMSAEGTITADIIKNAMFAAADDINAKFETMPQTFGSVWVQIKNDAIMKHREMIEKINGYLNTANGDVMIEGISNAVNNLVSVIGILLMTIMQVSTFISSNWSMIEPIVWGLVVAFTAYNLVAGITNLINGWIVFSESAKAAAQMIATGATFAETAAQEGLNAALYACPIVWIIALIIALIVIFYVVIAAVNKFAGTSVSATGIIVGAFMTALAFIGNLLVTFYNLGIDVFIEIWNFIAAFAEFFANVFDDPIGSVIRLFSGMADSILGVLEGIASAMDTLFGSHLADAVSGWRKDLQKMTDDVAGEAKIKVQRIDSTKYHLDRFNYTDSFKTGYGAGKKIESALDPSNLLDGITNATDQLQAAQDTASNTGAIKDSMSASEEDLKYLRDIAEQEVINRFTTAEIKVDAPVTAHINSEMDLDGVVTHLENKIYETMSIAAEGVHD